MKIPLWKIVGPPWKEGEIRLEVDKLIYLWYPLKRKSESSPEEMKCFWTQNLGWETLHKNNVSKKL